MKFFWPHFWKCKVQALPGITMIRDRGLANLTFVSVLLFALLLILKWAGADAALWMLALPPAFLIIAASKRREEIIRKVDWRTLVFFAAMFVLMQAVWEEGAVQSLINGEGNAVAHLGSIVGITIVVSQFISNLPLVALYLPILAKAGAGPVSYVALAGAASMAGNLTIMGAASNVILVEGARKRGVEISFWEFFKYGAAVTAVSTIILCLWLGIAG